MLHLSIFISCTISALFLYGSNANVSLQNLFPYGTENGDQEVPKTLPARGPPVSISDQVDLDFTMFGVHFKRIYVRADGSFLARNSRRGSDGYIWAFSADVNLRKGGSVYWRKTLTASDLKKARDEIGSAFPAYQGVDLKWAFIATWYQVSSPDGFTSSKNTFQAVLTTDGNQTYSIFMYNAIGWSGANNRYAHVGFAINGGSEYLVTGSVHPNISTIGNRSNIGKPGKWIFRIDQPKIYEPSSVCGIPPQPENGLCKAEGFNPESTALCLCKEGYKMDAVKLKCSQQANNKTFSWSGNMPVCPSSIQTTAQVPQLPAKSSDSAVKCPSPPIPQYGRCEKKDYHPGSMAKCNCLENYRNANPNGQLYCVIAEDGSLNWTGGMPMCVNSSA